MSDNRSNVRVAYYNGQIMPERDVRLPFRDRGFKYGDAAFDMTRTFGGQIFKIEEHVARFYRSLRYLRIDPGLTQAEMVAISNEVLERNRHFLTADTDFWVGQRVSRGVDAVGDEGWDQHGPTVIVECIPLPLKARARLFRDGIDIVVPPTRRTAPDMLSPRAKTHNYLNLIMADLEAKSQDKEAW
jgi:branched-chain amino acid aminotransferase